MCRLGLLKKKDSGRYRGVIGRFRNHIHFWSSKWIRVADRSDLGNSVNPYCFYVNDHGKETVYSSISSQDAERTGSAMENEV